MPKDKDIKLEECIICFELKELFSKFKCSHKVCNDCFEGQIKSEIDLACSLCREDINENKLTNEEKVMIENRVDDKIQFIQIQQSAEAAAEAILNLHSDSQNETSNLVRMLRRNIRISGNHYTDIIIDMSGVPNREYGWRRIPPAFPILNSDIMDDDNYFFP